jgi:hypothetical protein
LLLDNDSLLLMTVTRLDGIASLLQTRHILLLAKKLYARS